MNLRKVRKLFNHITPPYTRLASITFPPIQDSKNIDWSIFEQQYNDCQTKMREEHQWFEDGLNYNFRPALHKKIVLGRGSFYIQFADFYYERYGQRLYLLDLMLRQDDLNGQDSLLYYIEDAEEIHVNLEGILPEELTYATIGLGKLALDKREVNAPYTTTWEINQLFYKDLLNISYFHTGSAMTKFQAYISMGRRVPLNRISNDNRFLLDEWVKEEKIKSELVLDEL